MKLNTVLVCLLLACSSTAAERVSRVRSLPATDAKYAIKSILYEFDYRDPANPCARITVTELPRPGSGVVVEPIITIWNASSVVDWVDSALVDDKPIENSVKGKVLNMFVQGEAKADAAAEVTSVLADEKSAWMFAPKPPEKPPEKPVGEPNVGQPKNP